MQTSLRPPSGAMRAPDHLRALDERRLYRWLFVAAAAVFMLIGSGAITVTDGRAHYETARSLVEHGTLYVSDDLGQTAVDGGYVSRYGLGMPLVSVPAYVASKPFAALAGEHADLVSQAAVSFTMALISALLFVALVALGRRFGAGPRAAVGVAVGTMAGTFVLPYTKTYFSEPLVALALVVMVERLLAGRIRSSAFAFALAVITRPQMLALAPVLAVVWWRRDGKASVPTVLPPALLAGIVLAVHNAWRFGSPLSFGYDDAPGFTTPFFEGAAGLLFEPATSVLLFAPIVVALPFAVRACRSADRDAVVVIAANAGLTFVLSATWWSWAGGWSWGPRLLLAAVVPAMPVLAPWVERGARHARAVLALFLIGFLVSFPALIVSPRAQQSEAERVGPGVMRQYELIAPTVAHTVRDLDGRADGDAVDYVNAWQVNAASVLGAPGLAAAAGGSAVLLALAIGAAARARRFLE